MHVGLYLIFNSDPGVYRFLMDSIEDATREVYENERLVQVQRVIIDQNHLEAQRLEREYRIV